jgi:hypothetical protein
LRKSSTIFLAPRKNSSNEPTKFVVMSATRASQTLNHCVALDNLGSFLPFAADLIEDFSAVPHGGSEPKAEWPAHLYFVASV